MASQHTTTIEIRYAETDQMGMVHHGAYVDYLEQARVDHLKSLNLPYHEMERQGYFLPVVELHINYLKPARFGSSINVQSAFSDLSGVRLRVDYVIVAGNEKILEGHSVHAFVGPDGKPKRPDTDLAARLGQKT